MTQPTTRLKKFWATMFGYSIEEMARPGFFVTASGYYIERNEENLIFFWTDRINKKRILAASEANLARLQGMLSTADLQKLDAKSIRQAPFFKDIHLTFQDFDLGFTHPAEFTPADIGKLSIRPLHGSEKTELELFYSDCTEKDQDTLDLTFEAKDFALGLYNDGRLAAISRYAPIRETGLADVTVLVRNGERRLGFSTPLVSEIIKHALSAGYEIKYRVEETNQASIAIALRLGLKPLSHLLTWDVSQ